MPSGTQALSFCSVVLSVLAFILASGSLESENSKDLIYRRKDYVFPFIQKAKNSFPTFLLPVFCPGLIGQHWIMCPLLATRETRKAGNRISMIDIQQWFSALILSSKILTQWVWGGSWHWYLLNTPKAFLFFFLKMFNCNLLFTTLWSQLKQSSSTSLPSPLDKPRYCTDWDSQVYPAVPAPFGID